MLGIRLASAKKVLSARAMLISMLSAATITVITASALLSVKQVTVIDSNGLAVMYRTLNTSVGSFVKKSGIELGAYDEIYPAAETKLSRNQTLRIERAFPVKMTVAGEDITVYTTGKTVASVLEKNNIKIGEADIVNPSLDTKVTADTVVSVTKVTSDMIAIEEEIPFATVRVENRNMTRGATKVVTPGVNGKKEVMYNVTYHNGEEISREIAGERIITSPTKEVVQYGTQYSGLSSRGGAVSRVNDPESEINYSKVITCNASAYDLSYESCGKRPGQRGYGITASGMKAARGVVAVDPRVIPLGTKLYIQSLDSYPDYGYAVAGDTGGAIKGNRVDLFMESRSQALQFGRRSVKVYILD